MVNTEQACIELILYISKMTINKFVPDFQMQEKKVLALLLMGVVNMEKQKYLGQAFALIGDLKVHRNAHAHTYTSELQIVNLIAET